MTSAEKIKLRLSFKTKSWTEAEILEDACFLDLEESDSGEGYSILVNWGVVAEYETLEQAKEVVSMIGAAVNRGDEVFKLPEQEYFYQLESLFDSQRLLKRYLAQIKTAKNVEVARLKNFIEFETQRISEILLSLRVA